MKSNIAIKNTLKSSTDILFFVGAGISISKPSHVASATQIIQCILEKCCPNDYYSEIKKLDIRFEYLIETFRDMYDKNMNLINYFLIANKPNLIHSFLANKMETGCSVITTNFDLLIENALSRAKIKYDLIISKDDFNLFNNIGTNISYENSHLVKIHGSPINYLTNSDTRNTIVSTLDCIRKDRDNNFVLSLSIEKNNLLKRISTGKILIVIGYSGGDNLDIIPSFSHLSNLQQVIWIWHSGSKITSTVMNNRINIQGKILNIFKTQPCEVSFVEADTLKLIEDVTKLESSDDTGDDNLSFPNWFQINFPNFNPGGNHNFAGKILEDYGNYSLALQAFNKAYEIFSIKYNNNEFNYDLVVGNTKEINVSSYKVVISNRFDEYKAYISSILNLGNIAYLQGDYPKSIAFYNDALKIVKDPHANCLSAIYVCLGRSYLGMQSLLQAESYYKKAIECCLFFGDKKGLCAAYGSLTIVSTRLGNYEEAISFGKKALDLCNEVGSFKNEIAILSNLGYTYGLLGYSANEIDCYKRTYEIGKALGDLDSLIGALNNQGERVAQKKGHHIQSIQYFEEGLEIAKTIDSRKDIGMFYTNLSISYSALGRKKEALDLLDIAEKYYA